MRISDWSSDVCSPDLVDAADRLHLVIREHQVVFQPAERLEAGHTVVGDVDRADADGMQHGPQQLADMRVVVDDQDAQSVECVAQEDLVRADRKGVVWGKSGYGR